MPVGVPYRPADGKAYQSPYAGTGDALDRLYAHVPEGIMEMPDEGSGKKIKIYIDRETPYKTGPQGIHPCLKVIPAYQEIELQNKASKQGIRPPQRIYAP